MVEKGAARFFSAMFNLMRLIIVNRGHCWTKNCMVNKKKMEKGR